MVRSGRAPHSGNSSEDAMNVTCPNCATIYRVDPAKVPESGVRARCNVCSAVFGVRHEAPVVTTRVATPRGRGEHAACRRHRFLAASGAAQAGTATAHFNSGPRSRRRSADTASSSPNAGATGGKPGKPGECSIRTAGLDLRPLRVRSCPRHRLRPPASHRRPSPRPLRQHPRQRLRRSRRFRPGLRLLLRGLQRPRLRLGR